MNSLRPGRVAATAYYGGLRMLRVPALKRQWVDAGLILCYHNVVSGDDPPGEPSLHVAADRFERQMRWLAAHYEVVRLCEFVDRLAVGRSLGTLAAVTFDDGYAGVYMYALPILEQLGLPATVFLVADTVGTAAGFAWDGDPVPASHQAADWSMILAGRGRIDVGVHSATHRSLPTLDDAQLEDEIVSSRDGIQGASGVRPEFFAYPFGHWDQRVRERVAAAGYRAAFALDFGLNDASADRFALRRVNVPAGISDTAFEAWAAGLQRPWSAR